MAAYIGFFRKLMTEGHLHRRGDLRIRARAVRWDGRSSVSCIRRSCSADSANATRGRLRLSRYSLSLAGSSRGFGRASIWKVGGHSNGLVCLLVFLGMWRSGERRHDHSEPLFTWCRDDIVVRDNYIDIYLCFENIAILQQRLPRILTRLIIYSGYLFTYSSLKNNKTWIYGKLNIYCTLLMLL